MPKPVPTSSPSVGRRRHHRWWAALACSFLAWTSGCRDSDSNSVGPVLASPDEQTLASVLRLTALDALRDGTFNLHFGSLPKDGAPEEHARAIANSVLKYYAKYLRTSIEREAGRSLDLANASLLPRTIYVESPYEDVPRDRPVHERARWGPSYLFTVADPLGPVAVIIISALTSDYAFDGDRIVWPRRIGNQIRVLGVGAADGYPAPESPESAVLRVARATGANVIEPPAFVWLGRPFVQSIGAWRIVLDRPVAVETEDARHVVTREVYIENTGQLRVVLEGLHSARLVPSTSMGPQFTEVFLRRSGDVNR